MIFNKAKKLLSKILDGKSQKGSASAASSQNPENNPNMIRVFDAYGRELYISKQDWRDSVLVGNLEKVWDNPDELYNLIVTALRDNMAEDVLKAAEHLHKIDLNHARAATVLGIIYLDLKRLSDAERVLDNYIQQHGEDPYVLTNLAKVYSAQGRKAESERTLWHSLEIEPNQENGFAWYVGIQNDQGGSASALDAYRRIAKLPKSWRAQMWLGRNALENSDLTSAIALYEESLTNAGRPVPTDLLMQMSGDLGNFGHLETCVNLISPYFDPALHGLQVGNNLIKANLDLGRLEAAYKLLQELYGQKRPDWRSTLSFWDTELAKAKLSHAAKVEPDSIGVTMVSIEGPIWMRDGSPFGSLLAPKADSALRIAVFGSTVLRAESETHPGIQLSDSLGRLSRAIPLVMTEYVHLGTNALVAALIPWAQDQGFAVFGRPYEDDALCGLAKKCDPPISFIVGVTIDARDKAWFSNLRLLRVSDAKLIFEIDVAIDPKNIGPDVGRLLDSFLSKLLELTNVSQSEWPGWYCLPDAITNSDYMLRIEQLLATSCRNSDFLRGGDLTGERDMLDGSLQLCVQQPQNLTARMLFWQLLRLMKKVRPDILPEYEDKVNLLQKNFPVSGDIGRFMDEIRDEVFAV